jgi:hypothetical protein
LTPIADGEVLDLLTMLVEKSLVVYEEDEQGRGRYRLLETVRQYARDRLLGSGEAEAVRGRHLDRFLRLAEEAGSKLRGPEQAEWLELLDREIENLRGALEWSEIADGGTEAALRLVASTGGFWQLRYHRAEGLRWLEQALARCTGEATALRARALQSAALLCGQSGGPPEQCKAYVEESLAIYRKLGDKQGLAQLLPGEEGLALARELGDNAILAQCLLSMGLDLRDQLDWKRMEAVAAEALALSQELGDTILIAAAYRALGRAAMHRGEYARARDCFAEDLTRTRRLSDVDGIAIALGNLTDAAIQEANYPQARALCVERLTLARQMGHEWHTVHSLERLVLIALAQQQFERAVRIFGALQAWREATGCGPEGATAPWRLASGSLPLYEETLAPARAALSEAVFAAAYAEGRALPLDQVIDYALEESCS